MDETDEAEDMLMDRGRVARRAGVGPLKVVLEVDILLRAVVE